MSKERQRKREITGTKLYSQLSVRTTFVSR